jgi:serine/threonine-protein kinase
VLLVVGAVVFLGLGAYGFSLAGAGADKDGLSASPEPSVVAATGKCVISYTVWSDDGVKFKASVSVANRDSKPIDAWKLWFVMPGDQKLSGNGKVPLKQADGAVTVSSKDSLQPQSTRTMQVTGRYKESNAAPKVFQLDGETCETYVSGKPGAPSQPVQQLSDGSTRLGPVPTSSTPVPGLSTAPGGIVVPVPVPSKSTTPTGVPTTTPAVVPTTTTTKAPPPKPSSETTTPSTEPTTTTPTTEPTTEAPPPVNPPTVNPEDE